MRLDRKDIKRVNRDTVFQYIRSREGQVVSCVQLSQDTGISLPTILKIVDYFEKRGILKGVGPLEGTGVGRRPTMLAFVPASHCTLGTAFDGKYLACAMVDLNYRVLHSERIPLRCTMEQLMTREIPEKLEHFIAGCPIDRAAVTAMGLALPVALDTERNVTTTPAPVIGLEARYDFCAHREALTAFFGWPIYLENDVNAAAIGEFRERGLSAGDDLVYITLGTGLGGGIVLQGEIRRGRGYAAGEIAGLYFGDLQSCGATAESLLAPPRLAELFGYDAYSDSPQPAAGIRAADYIARHLAVIITNMEAVLDAHHYVLGGFVTERLRAWLLPFLEEYLGKAGLGHLALSLVGSPFAAAKGAGSLAGDKVLDRVLTQDESD